MMEAVERPKTGRGFRQRISYSNTGHEDVFDESKTGRPTSRMGFRPETYERHDYDEFSRQEPQIHSPDFSPMGGYNSPQVVSSPLGYRHCSPSHQMTVSPNDEYLSAQSPSAYRLSREMIHQRSPVVSPSYERMHNKHSISQHSPFQGELDEGQIFEFETDDRHDQNPMYEEYRPVSRDYHRSSPEGLQSSYVPILSGRDRYQYNHYKHVDSSHESEVFSVHEGQRSTPSRPRSSRPKSARKRPQSGRKRKENQEILASQESDSAVVRPHSSFLRFKPLPAIGSNGRMTDQERANELAEQTKQLHLKERHADSNQSAVGLHHSYSPIKDSKIQNEKLYLEESKLHSDGDETTKTSQVDSDYRFIPHKLPDEPTGNEMRLLLAVKLPDGKRVQRHFRLTDTLHTVKEFAENMACSDLLEYQIFCKSSEVVFKDLSQLLGETGLEDRTLLYMIRSS